MIWQKVFKNPMLVIGIIMFGLFLTQTQTQNWWQRYKARFIPSDCLTLLSSLSEHNDLKDFSYECESKNLIIKINAHELAEKSNANLQDDLGKIKVFIYRQTANTFKKISSVSNPETLRLLPKIYLHIDHSRLSVRAMGSGEDIVEMKSLKSQAALIDFIENHIKVKELVK